MIHLESLFEKSEEGEERVTITSVIPKKTFFEYHCFHKVASYPNCLESYFEISVKSSKISKKILFFLHKSSFDHQLVPLEILSFDFIHLKKML